MYLIGKTIRSISRFDKQIRVSRSCVVAVAVSFSYTAWKSHFWNDAGFADVIAAHDRSTWEAARWRCLFTHTVAVAVVKGIQKSAEEGIELLVAMLRHGVARAPSTVSYRSACCTTTTGKSPAVDPQGLRHMAQRTQPSSHPCKITRLRQAADSTKPACDPACLRSTSGRSDP